MFIIIVKFDKKVPIFPFPISSIARPQNFADAAFEKTYFEQFQASSDVQSKNLITMPGKLAFKKPQILWYSPKINNLGLFQTSQTKCDSKDQNRLLRNVNQEQEVLFE